MTNNNKIFDAIKKKETETALELIGSLTTNDIRDEAGYTPLHWAVLMGNQLLVEKLLAQGADPNLTNNDGNTPFHFAVVKKQNGIADILLNQGINPAQKNAHGETALEGAFMFGNYEIVQRLQEKGYTVDHPWLQINIYTIELRELELLVKLFGTPPQTVLDDLLIANANNESAPYLLKLGATPNVAYCKTPERAQLFLQYGGNINQQDELEQSLLNRAVCLANIPLIRFALDHGADIKSVDYQGLTPVTRTKYLPFIKTPLPIIAEINALLAQYCINHDYRNEFTTLLLQSQIAFEKIALDKINPETCQSFYTWLLALISCGSKIPQKEALREFVYRLYSKINPAAADNLQTLNTILEKKSFLELESTLLAVSKNKVGVALQFSKSLRDIKLLSSETYSKIDELLLSLYPNGIFIAQPEIDIKFDSPIELHARYLYNQIYSVTYPNAGRRDGMARYYHGITHVSRAANYVPVFANLYKKYDDVEAHQLTSEDIKLLQIATLLHDAGREGEGTDYWDQNSGTLIYQYLTFLGVKDERAKLFAEAARNKDIKNNEYFALIKTETGIAWQKTTCPSKNIYQKIIHDVDSLDIMRVCNFDAPGYLDFYKEIAAFHSEAFEDLAELIMEARGLIDLCGDGACKENARKIYYECELGYQRILETINKHYPLLSALSTLKESFIKNPLLRVPYNPKKGLEEANVRAALQEGKVFARAIPKPTAIKNKQSTLGTLVDETNAQLELRKTARRLDVATPSHKTNNTKKQGNPNRSVSMIGFGTGVYSGSGFLIINPSLDSITSVSAHNAYTGTGKKTNFIPPALSLIEKIGLLEELIFKLKMGGSSKKYSNFTSNHVEITYLLEDYDAIYFSPDPNPTNLGLYSSARGGHALIPFLQAIYLQNCYEKIHHKKLPIFEYSGVQNTFRKIQPEEYDNEKLKKMWATLCLDFINTHPAELEYFIELICKPIDELKIIAMYGEAPNSINTNTYLPADANYDNPLQVSINLAIYKKIEDLLIEKISSNENNLYLIGKVYRKISYFHDAFQLDWVKRIVTKANQLAVVLKHIPVLQQFSFLQKLGAPWLSELLVDFSAFKRIADNLSFSDSDKLQRILKRYNEIKAAGIIPLISAILENNQAAIKQALENCQDINCANENGFTPLHWAAVGGDLSLFKLLIEHGALMTIKDAAGQNALHIAAAHGRVELVKFLLEQGFNPLLASQENKTPLDGAIEGGHSEIATLLTNAIKWYRPLSNSPNFFAESNRKRRFFESQKDDISLHAACSLKK